MVAETEMQAPTHSIGAEQDALISEFAFFDDWTDRYQYLIDLGRKLPPLDEEFLRDEFKLAARVRSGWLASVTETGWYSRPSAMLPSFLD